MARTSQIQITDIPLVWHYQGYLWYSNATTPVVIEEKHKLYIDGDDGAVPFIIEGHLWCEEHKASFAIRYLNGIHQVIRFDLSEPVQDFELHERRIFKTHDIPKYPCYKVIEAWEEQEDPISIGFNKLTHAWTAFAGFQSKSEVQ